MEQSLQNMSINQRLTEWSGRIAVCRSNGQSVRQWCEENGVNEKTYYYWQRKVFQAVTQEPYFAEISLPPARGAIAGTVRMGKVEADIYHGADETAIAAIVRALKSR